LEKVREFLALPAPLPSLTKERHVLNTVERRTVDDLGVVADNGLLPDTALLGLGFGDVFTDNSTIAQEFVDVALMPHGLLRVPRRDTLFDKRPGDDAAPVSSQVHFEYPADELRARFEHMNLAVAHFKPTRNLARHDDAIFRFLAFVFQIRARSK